MSSQQSKIRLEKKLKENPQSLVFARLADIYLREDRIDDAIQVCQAGLKGNPSYVTGHFILAKAYMLQNDLEKAESALKKVLAHDKNFISAHKFLGDLMIKLGWENTAITHYKDILAIDPLESGILSILERLSDEIPEAIDLPSGAPDDSSGHDSDKNLPSKNRPGEEDWMNQIREVFPDDQGSSDTGETVSKSPEQEPEDSLSHEDTGESAALPPENGPESMDAGLHPGDVFTESAERSESGEPEKDIRSEEPDKPPAEHTDSESEESEPSEITGTPADSAEHDHSESPTPASSEPAESQTDEDAGFIEFDVDSIQFDDSASEPSAEPSAPEPSVQDQTGQIAPDTETGAGPVIPEEPKTPEPEENQPVSGSDALTGDSDAELAEKDSEPEIPDSAEEDATLSGSKSEASPSSDTSEAKVLSEAETRAVLDEWTENEDQPVQQKPGETAARSEEMQIKPGPGKSGDDVQEIVSEEEFLMELSPERDNDEEIDLHETFEMPSGNEEDSAEQSLDLDIDIPDEETPHTSDDQNNPAAEAAPPETGKEEKTAAGETSDESGSSGPENEGETISNEPPAESGAEKKPDTADDPDSYQEETMAPKILTPTLGEIYIAQGQFDKALEVYRNLLEMHPNEKKYQEKIAILQEKIKDIKS